MKQSIAVTAAALLLAQPGLGWNNTGHKVVAYIAYGKLSAKTRARVDALIQQHPQFEEFRYPGTGLRARRMTFANFAIWADDIKGDSRYVSTPRVGDDCKPTSAAKPAPGPVFPGFPDMERHQDWHYDDIPFSTDGTPTHPSCDPNAVTQLDMILKDLASPDVPDTTKTFELPWLEHLVGDVHQPLHAVSRFTAATPKGDQGGNLVHLTDGSNLHSFWDGLPGIPDSTAVVVEVAAKVRKASRKVPTLTPEGWVTDSADVARAQVYGSSGAGSQNDRVKLTDDYKIQARKTAFVRLGDAGQRLADVLNAALGQ